SFHLSDIPDAARDFVEPLVEHRWPDYDVIFPGAARRIDLEYATFGSARLHAAVTAAFASAPGCQLFLGVAAERWDAGSVTLEDGRRLQARAVIVARGPERLADTSRSGFLKFYGLELRLTRPSGLARPIVMDATCAQTDGFRFFYFLPFAADFVLVEDNYFS